MKYGISADEAWFTIDGEPRMYVAEAVRCLNPDCGQVSMSEDLPPCDCGAPVAVYSLRHIEDADTGTVLVDHRADL